MPGAESMARPKKGKAKPSKVTGDRKAVIHLKGSTAYVEWLESLYRKTHLPKATMFRLAMEEWAKNHGHEAPPEF
jgi:hypothetical protein